MTKKFKIRRTITAGFTVLIVIFVTSQAVWMFIAGPETVLRIYRYGDTNIDDFNHYPGRELSSSESPYSFSTE